VPPTSEKGKSSRATTLPQPDSAFADLKHADHRRLLSRWGKALFRFAGVKREAFARRSGSYRENFINVLTVCFGNSFEGPGSYWYDNSNAGAFASALLYCATNGRVSVGEVQAYALFTKKQPDRAASSWMVNEAQLVQWGVSPAELKALFAGESRLENGFPRGSPLSIPPPKELPQPALAGATPQPEVQPPAPVPTPPAQWAPVTAPAQAPAPVQQPSALPFSSTPLQRQNTVAMLATLMCQSDRLQFSTGKSLDRGFSEGARSFMAALAAMPLSNAA